MFDEITRQAWWHIVNRLITGGTLTEGTHFLVRDSKLYLRFHPCYDLYIDFIMDQNQPKEWLVPPGSMRKLLTTDKNYIFQRKKRLSLKVNVYTMVFKWKNQFELPAGHSK